VAVAADVVAAVASADALDQDADADAETVVVALAHVACRVEGVQGVVVDIVEWVVRLVDQAVADTLAFVEGRLGDVVVGCAVVAEVWALVVVVAVRELEGLKRLAQRLMLERTCLRGREEVMLGKWHTTSAGHCEAVLLLLRDLSRLDSSFDLAFRGAEEVEVHGECEIWRLDK
jgi:hypothetical protein